MRVYITMDGYELDGEEVDKSFLESELERLATTRGRKARVVLNAVYGAPWALYAAVIDVIKRNNLKLIENEIKEEE